MEESVTAVSTLTLVWASRETGDMQTPRRYLGFAIDGRPLLDCFRGRLGAPPDLVGPLDVDGSGYQALVREQLLLRAPGELSDGRQALLVCPECGDLGCGGITAVIERVGDQIVWRDFGHQYRDEPGLTEGFGYPHVGPFTFDAAAYERVLLSAPPDGGDSRDRQPAPR